VYAFRVFLRRFSNDEVFLAGIVVVCGLAWILDIALPSGSYLLFWPLICEIPSLLLRKDGVGTKAALSVVGTTLAILLFTPLIYLAYIFVMLQLTIVIATALLVTVVFIFSLRLMPFLSPEDWRWRWTVLALVAASVVCIGAGISLSHYSTEYPLRDNMLYSLNVDTNRGVWISLDRSLDAWTSRYFTDGSRDRHPAPEYLAGSSQVVFSTAATSMQLPFPTATIEGGDLRAVSEEGKGATDKSHQEATSRQFRMTIKSLRDAWLLYVGAPSGVSCSSISVAGRAVPLARSTKALSLYLYGMNEKETSVELTCRVAFGTSFWIMDESIGLPLATNPRPHDIVGWPGSDLTIVSRKYQLSAR
jgi:hypothetical protein